MSSAVIGGFEAIGGAAKQSRKLGGSAFNGERIGGMAHSRLFWC